MNLHSICVVNSIPFMLVPSGFLVIDKCGGLTSRRAVNFVQRWLPRGVRMGHAGTLDPLATGVLVVAIGRATRLIEYVQKMEKEYHAVLTLGATSDTDDADGLVTPMLDATTPCLEDIEEGLRSFAGVTAQVPPSYSAARVEGRRAHQLARRGIDMDLSSRQVSIHETTVLSYVYPRLELSVRCGKGTYIRSLARDLGERLGCGGYVHTLRRTRVGLYTLPGVELYRDPPDPLPLLPLESAISELAQLQLDDAVIEALGHGQRVRNLPQFPEAQQDLAVLDSLGRLRCIVGWEEEQEFWKAGKVFRVETVSNSMPAS